MDTDSGALAAILLGFLLGLKHATDADHVIAISTVVKEYKNAFKFNYNIYLYNVF